MKHQSQLAEENKEILCQIVFVVELIAKQGLLYLEVRVNFASGTINKGNSIATMQLLAKGYSILQKHRTSGQ